MNVTATICKQLPEINNQSKQSLVVLIDSDKNILAESVLSEQLERIQQLITASNFQGTLNESVVDWSISDTQCALQLVGIGKVATLTATNIEKLANTIYSTNQKRCDNIAIALADSLNQEQFSQFSLALFNASYSFDKYKSNTKESLLNTVDFVTTIDVEAELAFAKAVHIGQNSARDLANEPANVCYPEYMANEALALAQEHSDVLKVTVIDQNEMQQLGMNCFLSVSTGSDREGKLVILEYHGQSQFSDNAKNEDAKDTANAPIALVGKGVTFDTGGISLKPPAGMGEMKFDMGGSASVFGAVKALCESRLPINVVAALACAENMPSARATRPGDVVTAMNGKTVEILNTDAEGRLVLSDTLTYIQRYQPKVIIDVATLTGACIIALGNVHSAVYSKDEDLLNGLQNASSQSGDTIWHMPLDDEYQSQLDSSVADVQNIGGRGAGSVTAACFLSRFVEEGQAWAHLDVAGTAWVTGKTNSATGRPVPLFMQYLKNCVTEM